MGNGKYIWCRNCEAIHHVSSFDRAPSYQIASGEIHEKEIRKEMQLHFSWAPAAPLEDVKISLFVTLFREIVSELDPKNVRTEEFSYSDDNISYGQLDSSTVDALMTRCAGHFLPVELASIRRFVEIHREAGDVMALIKRRAVSVEQYAE